MSMPPAQYRRAAVANKRVTIRGCIMMTTAVPVEAVTIYNQALDLSNRGEFDSALNQYKKAIEVYPSFIEAYNNIGEIYSRMGCQKLAITSYMNALKIERNYRVLLNLGVEYYNNREYKKALSDFIESVTIKPDFLEGNFYTGMAYFNLNDLAKAEKFFSRVVSLDTRHLKANYLLSYIYYEWKDYGRTITCLDRIKDIADDISFINKYYGFCYYHLGRYNDAEKYLTVALESYPGYEKFRDYIKGLTYENKMKEIGDIDKKIKELEHKIMKEKPTLSEYTHLSMLYIFKGDYRKAEKLLLSAKKKQKSA
jgi:tetratricopeptide (TPR) repeat protein